jgi:antitoxin component YwqK of YwqJK toxin-antitoxin module
MRRVISLIVLAVCAYGSARAQVNFKGQVPTEKLYDLKDLYDSTYGIQVFDRFNAALGGDSVRKNLQGYVCNGWVQDHYKTGTLLHKGFYADGMVTLYTNYYPNGQEEREFKAVTERKSVMKKFYQDGKQRSEVEFYDGNAISYHDFFENGTPSYVEEYDKKHERLLQRCSYYPDGKPMTLFVPITDKKPIKYSHKEYFPGGVQVKEEYTVIYSSDALDYIKDGEDKVYDEKGSLVSDIEYVAGQENRTIK